MKILKIKHTRYFNILNIVMVLKYVYKFLNYSTASHPQSVAHPHCP